MEATKQIKYTNQTARSSNYEDFLDRTDAANAKRWVDFIRGDFLYNHTDGLWYYWDGNLWRKDLTQNAKESIMKLAIAMKKRASEIPQVSIEQNELLKIAISLESNHKQRSLMEIAKSLSDISYTQDDFDKNDNLFNLDNCTYNLKEETAMRHKKEDFLTQMVNYDFNPEVECPFWKAFLEKVFLGDKELIRFVQKAVGYTLTGQVSSQVMFFLYGTGKNGKSVFIETLKLLMGDYAVKVPISALISKRYDSSDKSQNEIARAKGKRLLISSETEENKKLAESVIKDITGGDTLTGRFLHQKTFEFKPTHKLWMYGNHKPTIQGSDPGIWRRVLAIPFRYYIKDDEEIPIDVMMNNLKAQMPGIFNWALEGLRLYKNEKLKPIPKAVREATQEYRDEMDVINHFIKDYCVISEQQTVSGSDLWKRFQEWKQETGEKSYISKSKLTRKLKEKGFEAIPGAARSLKWLKIGLISDPE